jgi:hypothetical protein
MPAFNITRRVNYRYMREVGVHYDLSADDCANLANGGFGHVIEESTPDASPASIPSPVVNVEVTLSGSAVATEETEEPHVEAETPAEVADAVEGSDDPTVVTDEPAADPLVCSACGKGPFKTAAAIANHRRSHN